MEFIKNHFYKLTKEIPAKQVIAMPSGFTNAYSSGFTNAYYGVYGSSDIYGSYGSYAISTYDREGNMVSPYEARARFTIGKIYQASSSTALYDDIANRYYLEENEIECFEEVEIGLNDISKKFMEKQINSGKMDFQFSFLTDNSMVVLKISLNGKYGTWACLMGGIGQINEILHNTYIELRTSYIRKFRTNLEITCRQARLMGGHNYVYDMFVGRVI